MATTKNFKIEQGTSWSADFLIYQDGQMLDESWSIRAQVRADHGSPVLYEWSTAEGNAVLTGGIVSLVVQPQESAAWNWRHGIYDLEISNATITERALVGTVQVSPEVTR